MLLFDTDIISILERKAQPHYRRLLARLVVHPLPAFYHSMVSFHEQVLGANLYISRAKDAVALVKGYGYMTIVLNEFRYAQVLPFDTAAAAEFMALRALKLRLGTMDLRIASIARSRAFTVLTRNLRDFTQVPGLKAENWTI